jgi:hypothetical protein
MVLLYWDLGREILERQQLAGWGAKIIDRLSSDLREAFPEMSGLSPRNLKYSRGFNPRESTRVMYSVAARRLMRRLMQRYRAGWHADSCVAPRRGSFFVS